MSTRVNDSLPGPCKRSLQELCEFPSALRAALRFRRKANGRPSAGKLRRTEIIFDAGKHSAIEECYGVKNDFCTSEPIPSFVRIAASCNAALRLMTLSIYLRVSTSFCVRANPTAVLGERPALRIYLLVARASCVFNSIARCVLAFLNSTGARLPRPC
jgi:hypothetical protein